MISPRFCSRTGGSLPRWLAILSVSALLAGTSLLPGCNSKEVISESPAAPPGATYRGPAELRGTIGSLARLEGRDNLLVSGFGVVVNLDGTGSAIVPEFLETWLVNEMRKLGVGSRSLAARNPGWERMTPQRVLRDPNTSVVRVSGFIPPGATKGTRFDLLIEALAEDTGTTSLAAGQLWQTSLSILGDNRNLGYTRPLAVGRGPVYISPYEGDDADRQDKTAYMRRAVIVGGGVATVARPLEVVLNQGSWNRAGLIRDVINERYRAAADERIETAVAKTELLIQLNIPRRYQSNPQHLLDLISHTFVSPVPVEATVDEMVAWMRRTDDPDLRRRAGLVIKALGPNAAEPLAKHYDDPDLAVRLAVLEAGAFLRDESTSDRLFALSERHDPATRIAVARALVHLPRSTRGLATLRKLLSDADRDVRLAAYESLAVHQDPLIDRLAITDPDGVKFVIDRVPADDPFIYITAEGTPRIVLFDPQLGFRQPVFASLWDNRLVLQQPSTIAQASQGLETGNVVFLPATHRSELRQEGGTTTAVVHDTRGGQATVRASNPAAVEVLRDALPESPRPGQVFAVQGRVVDQFANRLKVELLGVNDTLDAMPLSVYYRSPFEDKPTIHRVTPTAATLSFFLAHHPTLAQPQEGLDLNFGQVVDVLYQLGRSGDIPAPVELHLSPLAEMIADARTEAPPIDRPATDGNAPGRPEPVEAEGEQVSQRE